MPKMLSLILLVTGRIGLASLFILGAFNKVVNLEATALRMSSVGLEPTVVLLPAVVGLELIGGILVVFNTKITPVAAAALAIYTIAVNFFFHRFWVLDEPIRALELSLFFKNMSIAGALLIVAAGVLSVEKGTEGKSV